MEVYVASDKEIKKNAAKNAVQEYVKRKYHLDPFIKVDGRSFPEKGNSVRQIKVGSFIFSNQHFVL